MLSLMTVAIAFPMMHLATSPTPIGLTPGHLSRAISRLATKADIPLGSTKMEQICFSVGISGMTIDEGFGCCFGGCFFSRISRTDSGGYNLPHFSSSINQSAALTLPSIISFVNTLEVCSADLDRVGGWVVHPSFSNSSRFPCNHSCTRRSRWEVCSLALER